MRKLAILTSTGLLLLVGVFWTVVSVRAYKVGTTMTVAKADERWGHDPFDPVLFKKGTPQVRAKMVVDLARKKTYVGKPPADVFEQLGRGDGYFFSDSIPAYLLNRGWQTDEDTWQVVFLLTPSGEKVSDIIIHRNCCDEKRETSLRRKE